MPNQLEDTYKWALQHLKELYNQIQLNASPSAISTDCDQALRNALSSIFPESPALLCLWHTNKNIQQHCKGKFSTTEAYNDFFQAWQGLIRSPTEADFESRFQDFSTTYSATPKGQECVRYISSTWLKPGRKEALVQAWTNQYPHFGITVTSRYLLTI
jgi:hypothetical protein